MTETTSPATALTDVRPAAGRLVRLPLTGLVALVVLGGVTAAPAGAAAGDGTFYPTSVRCRVDGNIELKTHVTGAYSNHYVASRHYIYVWNGRSWHYAGMTSWTVGFAADPTRHQFSSPLIMAGLRGGWISMGTQVMFAHGNQWGPVQSLAAQHFQYDGGNPSHTCYS